MSPALDALCRQKAGKGDDWSPYAFTCIPRGSAMATHVEITGARHRLASRGPRKGQRIWGNEDKATVILSLDEYRSCFSSH